MVKNAVSGLGVAPDVAMVTFPIENFLPDADLAPLKIRKQEFYDGLTRAVAKPVAAASSAMLSVEGAGYEDALVKANNLFIVQTTA